MDIATLPQFLEAGSPGEIQAYDYTNPEGIARTKVNLTLHTISFLQEGHKEVIGDDETVRIDAQRFVIMKAGNCLMTERVSSDMHMYRSILLFFSDHLVMDFLDQHAATPNAIARPKSFYTFPYDAFLAQLVEGVKAIIGLSQELQGKMLKAKFTELMLYLTHLHGVDFLLGLIRHADPATIRIRNIVEHNKYNKLSLQELAFLAHMSVPTFKRTFVSLYQTTPIAWFRDARLTHVANLLQTGQHRPIDLYEEAGYENFSNFVQAFKKKFGQTPRQYQRQG